MLRGDALGSMPVASGSARRVAASRTGPMPLMVRPFQTQRPGAPARLLSPRRP
ncbi:MAG: hypothetical protein MK060_11630 [Blastomonas sp.]|uniref:hypothetical protein n=1 Tax=unclassified Blastomonas TaxID=2626550 RepID=UPI000B0D23ED|nr:hypothetical protein [Blastomonas sp.]MCH2238523.1 hypothetical protein [Blastomonas sp.]